MVCLTMFFNKNKQISNLLDAYVLVGQNKMDKAIAILTINSMLFSKVPNVYDSLGDVYEKVGRSLIL